MATATDTQQVRAQAKWVRTSARKARLVTEHIRGRSVPEARSVLAFTPRAAAREVEKVLRSAVANAEANHGLIGDELVVGAAYVDEGPTLKRWRPRARGRAARIKKRTCHITLLLVPAPESLEPTGGRRRRRSAKTEDTAGAQQKTATRRRLPRRKPAPASGAQPAAKPEAAETETASKAAQAAEKPRRRAPVRRKKTEEKES